MNAQLPVVSVIVPVYNAGAFLRRTLDCICGQTLHEVEIILVDDGSTDDSRSIQQEYAARDSRIILLQQEHEYAGVARNKGMAIARGKYLSFLDADDLFEPTMLEKMVARAEEVEADVVVCRCDIFYKEGEYTPLTWQIRDRYLTDLNRKKFSLKKEYPQATFQTFIGWAWDKLFLAEYVKEKGFRFGATRHGNDAPFVFPAVAAAGCISIIDESLVKYRKSTGQISASVNVDKSLGECIDIIENVRGELIKQNLNPLVLDSFYVWLAHYINWHMYKLNTDKCMVLKELVYARFGHEMKDFFTDRKEVNATQPYYKEDEFWLDSYFFKMMINEPEAWERYIRLYNRANQFALTKLFFLKTPTRTCYRIMGINIFTKKITRSHIEYRFMGIKVCKNQHNW